MTVNVLLDMLYDILIKAVVNLQTDERKQFYDIAIKWLEHAREGAERLRRGNAKADSAYQRGAVVMDDLISRQAALDALEWKWAGKAAIDAIKDLPSAEPTIPMLDTPISEWISLYNTVARDRKWCERCRYEAPRIVKGYHWTDDGKWVVETKQYLPRFCPCCGARMKGADDET